MWAKDFWLNEFRQPDNTFFWVFFRTLRPDTRGQGVGLENMFFIFLSNRIKSVDTMRETMIHEMIHAVSRKPGHGKLFKKWVIKMGLDPDLHCPKR